jgi:CheY-like chemotaxis protein
VERPVEPTLDFNFQEAFAGLSQAASYQGTILYIEDNVSNIRLMQKILAPYTGVQLLEAMQGKTGLAMAHLHTPDWILLDLQLPDMGGEDVLRALRQDPRTLGVPVAILSADATPGNIDRLKAAGACQYLTKPLDVRQLIGLLERTLPHQRPEISEGASLENNSSDPATSFHWDPEVISLRNLPSVLVEQLRGAVRDGEKARMDKLIAAVADHDGRSAQALRALADRYEYDTLTSLLAETSQ